LCAAAVGAAAAGCGGPAAGPGAPKKVTLPETPDGVVQAVMTAVVVDDKPQALWTAMPAKYQADIKGVIGEFANKMDKELWDKSFAVLGKLVKVAKDKKAIILTLAKEQGKAAPVDMEEVAKNWDSVVSLLEAIINSEIKTIDGLKKVDPETFMGTTLATIIKHGKTFGKASEDAMEALDKFKKAKVSLVKMEGDKATIKLETEGEEPKEMELTKVEGKWVPTDVAKDWDKNIAELKADIGKMDFQGDGKGQYLATLGMVEPTLDKLLAAKDDKEFMAAIMSSPLGMFLGAGGPPGGFDAPGGDLPKGVDIPKGLDIPKKGDE
jgi:hypothetical protein